MKKVLVVLTLVLGTLVSNAQLSVSAKSETIGRYGSVLDQSQQGELIKYDKSTGTEYTWSYTAMQNITKANSLKRETIKFKGDSVLINDLYNLLSEYVKNGGDVRKQLTLGDNELEITRLNMLGSKQLAIKTNVSTFYITKNQLDKLFGK